MFLCRNGVRYANPNFMFTGLAKFDQDTVTGKRLSYMELEMSFNDSIARPPE